MKNIKKKLLNYNIGSCLAGLFGRYLGSIFKNWFLSFYDSTLWVTFGLIVSVFISLFLTGDPYLSLIMTSSCFIFYSWYFMRAVIDSKFFLAINIFVVGVFVLIEFDFILTVLFAVKLILFLLIINTIISVYNIQMSYFIKVSLILLGFYLLCLCVFLSVIKIYFFNNISFFIIDSPILFETMPTKVFLSFKNWNFLDITKNPSFLLDFSEDSLLNDLAILPLCPLCKTKWLFYYLSQMILLSANNINLILIFV